MLVTSSLPNFTEDGEGQKIEEGEEYIGVDIVDALPLTDVLHQTNQGNQDKNNHTRKKDYK